MSRSPDKDSLEGRRILVLEDESLVAMEFESVLQEHGCSVLGPASTVAAAFRLIESERLDAALLDVNLPDGRSTALAAVLRERGVPFVMVTGYNLDQLGEPELMDACWVQKPADHKRLIRTLACALRRGAPGAGEMDLAVG